LPVLVVRVLWCSILIAFRLSAFPSFRLPL